MRYGAVITNRRANTANPCERKGCAQQSPSWKRKQHQPDRRRKMDQYDPPQGEGILGGCPPPRPLPRTLVALRASLGGDQDAASLKGEKENRFALQSNRNPSARHWTTSGFHHRDRRRRHYDYHHRHRRDYRPHPPPTQ